VSSKRVICEELARQPCSVIAVNQLFLHVTALSINNGCNGGLELYGQLLSPSVRRWRLLLLPPVASCHRPLRCLFLSLLPHRHTDLLFLTFRTTRTILSAAELQISTERQYFLP
jgi:hypothetical protein